MLRLRASFTPESLGGERGLVVGRWICNPEVPGSNPPPCHWMDLSSVAPNSTPPRLVNSQLVSLPPVEILNLLCLICIIFVCYAHLNIFTWNLRDINVYYHYHCQESKKKVLSVDYTSEDEEYEYVAEIEVKEQVNALAAVPHPNKVFATLLVNGNQEKFQLDSGSTVNIMTDETVLKLCGQDGLSELEEIPVTQPMYNQSELKPLGKKQFKVVNPKNNKKYSIEFHLVRGECKPILGLRASEHLQLLTVNSKNIVSVGSSGVEEKGSKLEDYISQYTDGVIRKVDTPTSWILTLVVTTKKNGKVRLCIDPKPLNEALHRNHYPLPTTDDVLPLLSKVRVFTVLDAKNGFWHIQLNEPTSFATTIGTPWGRYRWLRFPFGVSPAPEEFQRRIDIALEGLPGQKAIADDILVFGAGDADEEALKDNDRNLQEVFSRCRQKGIKLNSEKIQFRQFRLTRKVSREY